MKKILLSLVCLVLFAAVPALAEEVSFSKLSLNVPNGWTASEDNGVVAVLAPGKAAALSIVYDSTKGASGADIAKAMSQVLGGTPPQKDEEAFVFTFKKNNVESTCILAEDSGQYVMFTITDPSGEHGETIGAIINSITEK